MAGASPLGSSPPTSDTEMHPRTNTIHARPDGVSPDEVTAMQEELQRGVVPKGKGPATGTVVPMETDVISEVLPSAGQLQDTQ